MALAVVFGGVPLATAQDPSPGEATTSTCADAWRVLTLALSNGLSDSSAQDAPSSAFPCEALGEHPDVAWGPIGKLLNDPPGLPSDPPGPGGPIDPCALLNPCDVDLPPVNPGGGIPPLPPIPRLDRPICVNSYCYTPGTVPGTPPLPGIPPPLPPLPPLFDDGPICVEPSGPCFVSDPNEPITLPPFPPVPPLPPGVPTDGCLVLGECKTWVDLPAVGVPFSIGAGGMEAMCDPIGATCTAAIAFAGGKCIDATVTVKFFPDPTLHVCAEYGQAAAAGAIHGLAAAAVEGVAYVTAHNGDSERKDFTCTAALLYYSVCMGVAEHSKFEERCLWAIASVVAKNPPFTSVSSVEARSPSCNDTLLPILVTSGLNPRPVSLEELRPEDRAEVVAIFKEAMLAQFDEQAATWPDHPGLESIKHEFRARLEGTWDNGDVVLTAWGP